MRNGLSNCEIEEIKGQAREKLGICRKTNDIIGPEVFSILEQYARAIYYPLGKDAPWGFTRISGSNNDAGLDKPFVAINTSIPKTCQVFAAAHELYHIWYEKRPDILPGDLLDEDGKGISEKKANRFAAEFLVDEMMLCQKIEIYKIRTFGIKEILRLAELFYVPYRAMVKRLNETNHIGKAEMNNYLAETEESVEINRKRYAISLEKADERIKVDNLVDLSMKAFEGGLITFEKLEYLLGICGLKPEEIGIKKPVGVPFPSDEELDSIMEEDECWTG